MNQPICLFDSGIGGLTVLKKLIHKFPNENYIYLADLAHVPFGDRSNHEIKNIAIDLIEWLSKFNPKFIIMACNTSSAVLSSSLQSPISNFNIPIYGMIENCAKKIAMSNYDQISVWATSLVVQNNGYKNLIQKFNLNMNVEEISCPKLVPMIEDLNFNYTDKHKIIKEYVEKISAKSKMLILGCTHYPLIEDNVKNLINIEIVDPADSLLKELELNLKSSSNNSGKKNVVLYSTAQPEKLQKFSKIYLDMDLKVTSVSLSKAVV